MINYLSVGVTHPPVDKEILVKNSTKELTIDSKSSAKCSEVKKFNGKHFDSEQVAMALLEDGFDLWAEV